MVAARACEYDLIIVDYVGLMAQDGGGRAIDDWRVMASISNALKITALSQKTALLCAAQINREGENGSSPPKVKNLAQSDALGQDGDVVLTMRSKPHDVATHFSLEKNRHGASGIQFWTTFSPNTGVFTEISRDHADDLVLNAEVLGDPDPAEAAGDQEQGPLMSTAVATKPIQHTISWGLSRWVCIHPHCDGYAPRLRPMRALTLDEALSYGQGSRAILPLSRARRQPSPAPR